MTEVAQDRREAEGEKEREYKNDRDDEQYDRNWPRRLVPANGDVGDARNDGEEDDREESADVDDFKLFAELPGEGDEQENDKREEDVATDGGRWLFFLRGQAWR